MKLILASGSPRRRELLDGLGLTFEIKVSDLEEKRLEGEAAEHYVERLAVDKALAVSSSEPDAWILAADTVVFLEGEVLEKPQSETEARAMLSRLAGAEHVVFTGVALVNEATSWRDSSVTASRVRMASLSEDEIAWYVGTGEPMDKAGAYAIQGIGAMFIEGVSGNYSNIVGLPLSVVYAMLKKAGIDALVRRK
jgi:septum formation protein